MAIASLTPGSFVILAAMPWAYLFLWFASLAASIALVALLRTRWGQSRPMHRCAVLSLLVHLMLAWAAMTVRIVTGDGSGSGAGPSIRVRVVGDPKLAAVSLDEPIAAAPPLLEAPAPVEEPQPEQVEQETPSEIAKVEAPPEPAVAETRPETVDEPKTDHPAAPDTEKVVDAQSKPAEPDPAPATTEPEQVAEAPHEAVTETPANMPTPAVAASEAPQVTPAAIPPQGDREATATYSLRNAEGRLGLVEQQGGSGHTEAAVDAALRWLAASQSRDGRWDANAFGAGQEQLVLGQNRGGAGRSADTGISALAILAFLGAGHSHQHGDYQDTVTRGFDFLLRSQAADGSLFGNATLYAQMYCHSMAAFALAEAQAMTGDRRLEAAVSKAVQFSISAQNTSVGGWRYRPGDAGDTSQMGWQIMALASAQRAGINVPSSTWSRIDHFLRSVRRGERGGLAAYRPDGPASTSMTAEALYCRLLQAETVGGLVDESAAEEATRQLLAMPPTPDRINLYYWYYATLALHHRHQQDDEAASAWKTWNEAMATVIVSTQVTGGANAGSWDTHTVWGGYGGRVYTTAMAAMCLEVYYRYAPPPAQKPEWTATRSQQQSGR
jgi:outer membrane biosynthesis protein TonB